MQGRQDVLDTARRGLHTDAIMAMATDEQFRTLSRELRLEFLAEVLTVTHGVITDSALQHARQGAVEE